MKIKLGVGEIPYAGYLNIDPCPLQTQADCEVVIGDPRMLYMVEQSECTEILAPNILDYIHVSQLVPFITLLVSKLRHGGKIILGGTDLHTICRSYMIGELKPEELINILYGEEFGAWKNKVGCYPLGEISNILKELDIQIIRKQLENQYMFVEGVRP